MMFWSMLILMMIYDYDCDLTSKMQNFEHKWICIYEIYSHDNGGWNPFIWVMGKYTYFIFNIMDTDDLVTQGADTDLFTADSLRILEVNVCNCDYWKHAHKHMTVQNQWSHLEPSIRDPWAHNILLIMKDGCGRAKTGERSAHGMTVQLPCHVNKILWLQMHWVNCYHSKIWYRDSIT